MESFLEKMLDDPLRPNPEKDRAVIEAILEKKGHRLQDVRDIVEIPPDKDSNRFFSRHVCLIFMSKNRGCHQLPISWYFLHQSDTVLQRVADALGFAVLTDPGGVRYAADPKAYKVWPLQEYAEGENVTHLVRTANGRVEWVRTVKGIVEDVMTAFNEARQKSPPPIFDIPSALTFD